jgi:hypothetical protein
LTKEDDDEESIENNEFETVIESTRSVTSSKDGDKYEQILNEFNSFKNSLKSRSNVDDEQYVRIPVRDYENIISRLTLLENKSIINEVCYYLVNLFILF